MRLGGADIDEAEDAKAEVAAGVGPLIDELEEWRPGKPGSDGQLIAIIHELRRALAGEGQQ